ncbi:MAG: LPP20 family lipoprotein [Deltaproteobacteria bacterium]|nr:LPP20 family lipoprotein [Deltaproteobacteria bacterium]MBW2418723.1 LPP20 family lipoprotein [Deltaproteobacteria bacterium]
MRVRIGAAAAILGFTACVIAGCTSPPPEEAEPHWVARGPSKELTQGSFAGVGSGRDPETAAAVARAEIASVFHARIEQVLSDRQSTRLQDGGEQSTEEVDIHTRVETRMALEGVEIVEAWRDPASGRCYALAALDRGRLRARLSDAAALEQELIAAAVALADGALPAEEQLGAVAQALDAARRRDALLANLRVAGGTGEVASDREPSAHALERRLSSLKSRLPIGVEAWEVDLESGARLGALDPLRVELAKIVTELGFPVSQGPRAQTPWLQVECSLGFAAAHLPRDRWPAYRWEASLEVSKARGDDVLAVASEHGRATGVDDELARVAARRDAEAILSAELGRWLSRLTLDASASLEGAELDARGDAWTP